MASSAKESKTDVLIIGAGPSGLMLATQLSRLHIATRILDKRSTKIFTGQADGLQCRTLEIFDSFGFADRVLKEANHMIEFCMWNPDAEGKLRRSDRVANTPRGISRFGEVVLTQGRIERFFLDAMMEADGLVVERGVLPEALEFDRESAEDQSEGNYPVTVMLRHLSDEEATPAQNNTSVPDGLFRSSLAKDDTDDLIRKSRMSDNETEVLRAKYVVGCDGAHSWTRKQLGPEFELDGESTDYLWGVLDIIPLTDFPDIRSRCAIHSAESGSMMVIPREKGMVRLYIQLTEVKPDESGRTDRSKITPDSILAAAQKIIKPYSMSYEYCDWWTGYQIGQRVGHKFSDCERIFLAGDAIHTHSPKAGQGMNVSIADTYNLAWKLALTVRGTCNRSILSTYESERRAIAKQLIEFDHKFSRLFSGRPAKDAADEAGVSMKEFKEVYEKGHEFAAGVSVKYETGLLVSDQAKQDLATGIVVGKRFPSEQVVNQSDGRTWPLQHWLKSDGRFYIMFFAGNVAEAAQMKRVQSCCSELEGLMQYYTPADAKVNSIMQVITVHSSPRTSLEKGIFDLPELLRGPFDAARGWDYNRIFTDDESYHAGHGKAYEGYGIDKERGCLVVCRPDQYVSWIGELDDVEEVQEWFVGFMQTSGAPTNDSGGGDELKVKSDDFVKENQEGADNLTAKPLDQVAGLAA